MINRLRTVVPGGAHPGQILVMSALFFTVMIGVLGLAVDLGFAFSQRRSMQNAADAGALTGAHIVAKSTTSAPVSAQAAVETVVRRNAMSGGTIGAITCTYVNDTGGSLGGCGGTVPAAASGVKVFVEERHPTFFIQAVPGAQDTVTTSADATAHVKMLGSPKDGPFLPCGVLTQLAGGGTFSIAIKSGGSWVVNPDAVGKTFQIHGPQIEKCKAKASRYKGLADVNANRSRTTTGWFNYTEGTAAGSIANDVEGPNGCKAGQVVDNCVVFLPVVVDNPEESGNNKQLWTVFFAPFYVTSPKSNEHNGKLLDTYVISGRGQGGNWGWYRGYAGPITIRLTE